MKKLILAALCCGYFSINAMNIFTDLLVEQEKETPVPISHNATPQKLGAQPVMINQETNNLRLANNHNTSHNRYCFMYDEIKPNNNQHQQVYAYDTQTNTTSNLGKQHKLYCAVAGGWLCNNTSCVSKNTFDSTTGCHLKKKKQQKSEPSHMHTTFYKITEDGLLPYLSLRIPHNHSVHISKSPTSAIILLTYYTVRKHMQWLFNTKNGNLNRLPDKVEFIPTGDNWYKQDSIIKTYDTSFGLRGYYRYFSTDTMQEIMDYQEPIKDKNTFHSQYARTTKETYSADNRYIIKYFEKTFNYDPYTCYDKVTGKTKTIPVVIGKDSVFQPLGNRFFLYRYCSNYYYNNKHSGIYDALTNTLIPFKNFESFTYINNTLIWQDTEDKIWSLKDSEPMQEKLPTKRNLAWWMTLLNWAAQLIKTEERY